jgi:hypothetical protein
MLRKLANNLTTILIILARVRGMANPSILPEGHRIFYRIIPTPHNHKIFLRGAALYIEGYGVKKTPRGTSPRGLNKKQHVLSF